MKENADMIAETESTPTISRDEIRLAHNLKRWASPIRFQMMKTLAERQTCITQEIRR